MKNNSPKEIFDRIKKAKKIFISLHNGPDGDSFGSATAMKYFLERDLKKEVELISPDNLGNVFELFDFYKEVKFGSKYEDYNLDDFDLFIFIDHANLAYYGKPLILPKEKTVNIDHHETNPFYGGLNYVNKNVASACSVLIELFKEWNVKFDKELSTRLLLGLYTDSLEFTTMISAFKEASFLIDNGADYMKIVDSIKFNVSFNLKRYFALLTNKFRMKKIGNYTVGYSSVSLEDLSNFGLNLSEIRIGPNYLQDISGIDFLFTLGETEDLVKGSFRSRKNVDVSLFAKELGGGGHLFAAAFKLPKMPLDEAEKKVFDAIKKVGVHIVSKKI